MDRNFGYLQTTERKESYTSMQTSWMKVISLLALIPLKKKIVGHMSIFGATYTPVSDFWWRLLWVSKPE